ncbi:MAG: ATP-binding protein, partial [Pseudomonadales bacterium]
RKRLEGLDRFARTKSRADEGIYTAQATEATYHRLASLAGTIVAGGYAALVDATHLSRSQRALIGDAARRAQVPCIIVNCHAPKDVLETRVADRTIKGRDVSEADLRILQRQLETMEPVEPQECEVIIDVDTSTDIELDQLVARILEACQCS